MAGGADRRGHDVENVNHAVAIGISDALALAGRGGGSRRGRGSWRGAGRRQEETITGRADGETADGDESLAGGDHGSAGNQAVVADAAVLPGIGRARHDREGLQAPGRDVHGLVGAVGGAQADAPLAGRVERRAVPGVPTGGPIERLIVAAGGAGWVGCGQGQVAAGVAQARHAFVQPRLQSRKGNQRGVGREGGRQAVEAQPGVPGIHHGAAPGAASGVERNIGRLALRGPFDDIILTAMTDPKGRHLIGQAILHLRLVILPVPDARAVVALQMIGPGAGAADQHGQVERRRAPLGREIRAPIQTAAIARGGVVGHRFAGIGRGKKIGIAQGKGQRAAAAHGGTIHVQAIAVHLRSQGGMAQQVVEHAQDALLGVVDNGVAGQRRGGQAIVSILVEAKVPGLADIHRVDVERAPVRVGMADGWVVGVVTPTVQRHEQRRLAGHAAVTQAGDRLINHVVVGVLERARNGRRIGIQAVVGVGGVGRMKRGVPLLHIHVLNEDMPAGAHVGADLHGQRVADRFRRRPHAVGAGKIAAILLTLAVHRGDGVVTGAGGEAAQFGGVQLPDQQTHARRQRRGEIADDKAVYVARLPDAAAVHIVTIGVETAGILGHFEQRPRLRQVGGVDRQIVAVDAVMLTGQVAALGPGDEGLAAAVHGGDVGGLRRRGADAFDRRAGEPKQQ